MKMVSHENASAAGPDFIQSLARGLEVITAFSVETPQMTLTEVANATGLTRATARRLLLTLEKLGYARTDGKKFALTPKVLDLGFAYLSSLSLGPIAEPFMESLSEQLGESTSAAVLDGDAIVYVVRVPTTRLLTVSLGLGSRLPAFCTSMGRILLAHAEPSVIDAVLCADALPPMTPRTLTDPDEIKVQLADVRQQGWALVDQELEIGVRSIAAPITDRSGRVVAAVNVSSHASRVTLENLRGVYLQALLTAAADISERLARRG